MRDIWWIDPDSAGPWLSSCCPWCIEDQQHQSQDPRGSFPFASLLFSVLEANAQILGDVRARNVAPNTRAEIFQQSGIDTRGQWGRRLGPSLEYGHTHKCLRSWKDFLIVSEGQDRHVVVVQDRNVLMPGCEVSAVLNFWLNGEKLRGGEYWKMF